MVNAGKRAYQLVKDLNLEKQGRSSAIQDRSAKCLTEEQEILRRGQNIAQNCTTMGVVVTLQFRTAVSTRNKICDRSLHVEIASLKKAKSAGVDNIPAELVQAGGEILTGDLTEICYKIWRTEEWPTQ